MLLLFKLDLLLNTSPSLEIMKLRRRKKIAEEVQCICPDDCSDCLFQLGNSSTVPWITSNLYLIFGLIISVVLRLQNTSSFVIILFKLHRAFVQPCFILGPNEKKIVSDSPFEL